MKTELRALDGIHRFFIDDRPHPGVFCSTPMRFMQNFIDAGFDIFDTHPLTPHGWVGPDQYDYTETDEYIEGYLNQKPDALLILRFWMGLPQRRPWHEHKWWWEEQHPDETVQILPDLPDHAFRNRPSFASLKWRAEAGEALRRVVEHCEARYGDRVVAYVPGGGPCGEWFHWFYPATPERSVRALDDYSAPMLRAYRDRLANKYRDVNGLNQAWNSRYDSIDQVQLPSPEDRMTARLGNLRSLPVEQPVVDFYEVMNLQLGDTLLEWAAKTKQGCGRNKAVMAFYGYHWNHQVGGVSQPRSGHLDLDRVLNCPDIDFIVAPIHYSFRQTEGVVSGQGTVTGPILRGKQYLHELDGSTFKRPCWPCKENNLPRDAAESGELLRRELGKVLIEGSTAWYMDLGGGMYDDPGMIRELNETLELARKHMLHGGRNNRQVAVVLNPYDACYYREDEPLLPGQIAMFKQFELERMGLSYDDMTFDDLEHLSPEQTSRYRFWVFPSAAHLTDRQIQAIRRHCLRNGNHVLWINGVAVAGGEKLDLDKMEAVTGFRCGYTLESGELAVRIEPSAKHPLLAGLAAPITYGTYGDLSPDEIKLHAALKMYPSSAGGFQVTPRLYVQDQRAASLGVVLDLPGNPTGLAVRDMGDWVSVLSTAPLAPKAILRNIARAAGCHVYTDFLGQTYHCHNYLGVFFHADGPCRLRLPEKCAAATDIRTGLVLAKDADELEVVGRINTTLLLKLDR